MGNKEARQIRQEEYFRARGQLNPITSSATPNYRTENYRSSYSASTRVTTDFDPNRQQRIDARTSAINTYLDKRIITQ